MSRARAIGLCLLMIGCDPSSPASDAGTDGGQSTSQIEAPASPAPSTPDACPEGWARRELGASSGCVPWLEAPSCPTGEARLLGDDACAPIGGACPPGDFAEGLSGDVRYVAMGGSATAAGTASDPFGTLDDALVGVTAPTTIALGRGTFEITFVEPPDGVRIAGACASETRIETSHVEGGRAMIAARAGTVQLSGVTLSGTLIGAVAVGGTLALDGVVIEQTAGVGALALAGGRIEGSDVIVRDVQPGGDGNAAGLAQNGGVIALSRVEVSGVPRANVYSMSAAGQITLSDAHLHDAAAGSQGAGIGLEVDAGEVTLERSLVAGGTQVGVKVGGAAGTTLALRDVVVRDVSGGGAGVLVGLGADLHAERLLIERSGGGVQVQDSTATVRDLLVADHTGAGLSVLRSSEVTLERATLAGGETGLLVGRMASAAVSDLIVTGTVGSAQMPYAPAVLVVDGASLSLERATLRGTGSGVIVGTNATATLSDLSVGEHTASDDAVLVGVGIAVADVSTVTLTRARVERALAVGITVEGADSRLEGTDVVVEDTLERRCPTSCGAQTFGSSVVATDGGYIGLERFEIARSALAGVRILTGATMDLREGEVREHPIGIDIQTAGFDPNRIQRGVLYLDNDRNVARSEVPPPDVTIPEI